VVTFRCCMHVIAHSLLRGKIDRYIPTYVDRVYVRGVRCVVHHGASVYVMCLMRTARDAI